MKGKYVIVNTKTNKVTGFGAIHSGSVINLRYKYPAKGTYKLYKLKEVI
jgi:hypothetical protein